MILFLSISLLALVVLALWVLVAFIKQRRWMFLVLAIPVFVGSAVSTLFTVKNIMGLPTTEIPAKFVFLDYVAVNNSIFVWYIDKDTREPRTVKMPYSKELHKQMEEAKQQKKGGQTVVGKKKDGQPKDKNAGLLNEGPFEMHNFSSQAVLPEKKSE